VSEKPTESARSTTMRSDEQSSSSSPTRNDLAGKGQILFRRRVAIVGIILAAIVLVYANRFIYSVAPPSILYGLLLLRSFVTVVIGLCGVLAVVYAARKEEVVAAYWALAGGALAFAQILVSEPVQIPSRADLRAVQHLEKRYGKVVLKPPDIATLARIEEISRSADVLQPSLPPEAKVKQDGALRMLESLRADAAPLEWYLSDLRAARGVILTRVRNPTEALKEADAALAIWPDNVLALTVRCSCLRVEGNLVDANSACDRALALDSRNALAQLTNGSVLADEGLRSPNRKQELFERALAHFEISLRSDPTDARAWSNKAVTLRRLRRPEEALKAVNVAFRIDPAFDDALLNKGTILKDLKRLPDAIRIYEKLTQLNPTDPEAWSNLGDARELAGDYVNALTAYDAAIQSRRSFADAWFNRGHVLNRLARHAEALESLDEAVRLNPEDYEAYGERAKAEAALGDLTGARESVSHALALAPDYEEARELRKKLATGSR
jgi:tetratricopeptide (TPR) repeat protein